MLLVLLSSWTMKGMILCDSSLCVQAMSELMASDLAALRQLLAH